MMYLQTNDEDTYQSPIVVPSLGAGAILSAMVCTAAVIGDKMTTTARSMTWKIRDINECKNVMKGSRGIRWTYLDTINISDCTGLQIFGRAVGMFTQPLICPMLWLPSPAPLVDTEPPVLSLWRGLILSMPGIPIKRRVGCR